MFVVGASRRAAEAACSVQQGRRRRPVRLPCLGVAKFVTQVSATAASAQNEEHAVRESVALGSGLGAVRPLIGTAQQRSACLLGVSAAASAPWRPRLARSACTRGSRSRNGQRRASGFVFRAVRHLQRGDRRGLTPRSRPSPNSRMPGRRSRACLSSSAPARHPSVAPGLSSNVRPREATAAQVRCSLEQPNASACVQHRRSSDE